MRTDGASRRSPLPRVLAAAFAAFGAAAIAGCPGSLQNKDLFLNPCDVTTDIFQARCSAGGCHNPIDRQQGLDLESPNVASRLLNKPATSPCVGTLVVPGNPDASLLYQKLTPSPPCGSQMPYTPPALSSDELACVRNWIIAQAPSSVSTTAVDLPADEEVTAPADP